MKLVTFTRFFFTTALVSAAAYGLDAKPAMCDELAPTVYDVSGDGLHVTYATATADGTPRLTFVGPFGELDFSGPEIRTVAYGDVGTLVSVTIQRTIDTGSTSFTLVIPPVLMQGSEAPIEIVGISTHHRFSVFRRFNQGQIDSYAPVTLTGTAR
jgi:hypothetical protein